MRAAFLALGLAAFCSAVQAECRLALALALDVSGSIDSAEHRLQRSGLANALRRKDIVALLTAPGQPPVELMIYEWSGPESAAQILPWTQIATAAQIGEIARVIETAPRLAGPPSTALGAAMGVGISELTTRSCWKRTLDISGDGKSNTGPRPAPLRDRARQSGISINALVIGADAPATGDARHVQIGELSAYFQANVIAGADSFVETALGFSDYESAMTRKLKRELSGVMVSMR